MDRGVKKSVRFSDEQFPELVRWIRNAGQRIHCVELDRIQGRVTLWGENETLDQMPAFKADEGKQDISKSLKIRLKATTDQGNNELNLAFDHLFSDFIQGVTLLSYEEDRFMTIRFSTVEQLNRYRELVKDRFIYLNVQ